MRGPNYRLEERVDLIVRISAFATAEVPEEDWRAPVKSPHRSGASDERSTASATATTCATGGVSIVLPTCEPSLPAVASKLAAYKRRVSSTRLSASKPSARALSSAKGPSSGFFRAAAPDPDSDPDESDVPFTSGALRSRAREALNNNLDLPTILSSL